MNRLQIIDTIVDGNSQKNRDIYFKKHHKELYNEILNHNNKYLNLNIKFKEILWYWVNNIKDVVKCPTCLIKTPKFNNNWRNGYREYCSPKCMSNNKKVKEKVKSTNLERYGSENVFSSNVIKEKVKSTNLERYGVENPMMSSTIKEKVKSTNLERYGVENPMMSSIIKEKVKSTNLERYGVDSYSKTEEYKEKVKSTNLERYGVDNYSKTDDYKEKVKNTTNKLYFDMLKNNYSGIFSKSDEYKIIGYTNGGIDLYHKKCNSINSIKTNLLYSRVRDNSHEYCINCNPINSVSSSVEIKLKEFISSLNIEYISNDRTVLDGRELDIYIPKLNLAIEFNGLYWHSELYKDKSYHLNKTLECNKKGIQLLHIFEDDWVYKRPIVESIIKNKLGKIQNKIYARKTEIKEVKSHIVREFLDINHIQGFSRSTYKLGLYYNNELVSLMTFGYRKTNSKKEFELIRFCNKLNWNVIGASSKLFKYFIKNYKDKIEELYILSYADISLFDGNMYETLGFKEIHLTKPNYFWIVDKKREHRWKYNKQNLIKEGFDGSKTEVEIMHSRNYYRIYGCGQKRYEYIL